MFGGISEEILRNFQKESLKEFVKQFGEISEEILRFAEGIRGRIFWNESLN